MTPDVNSLLFVPTSETLPKGDHYYRNFEILFNNLGLAITDEFNLSLMTAFPVSGDLELGSVGGKLRIVSREASPVGIAVAGSVFFLEDETLTTLHGITTVGNRRHSLNLATSIGFADGESEVFFLVGADTQISDRMKLLAEFGTSESAIVDTDFKGLINAGVRVFWDKGSFSLTALRPLEFDGDGLWAIPMGQVSLHF